MEVDRAMPLFYTHLENSHGLQPDETGRDFPDDQHAVRDAAHTAGAILSDELAAESEAVSIRLMVERADGTMVAAINVRGRVRLGADAASPFGSDGDSAG